MQEKDMDILNEFATVITWTPAWSMNAPRPQAFANEHTTFLSYYSNDVANNPVLVTFSKSLSHRFVIVNDESISGHSLYEKGLETFKAHLILNSRWIEEHRQIHKVHPRYSAKSWVDYQHYLLFFNEEIFEIIFSGEIKIEKFNSIMKETVIEAVERLSP